MNAERLHRLLTEIRSELDDSEILEQVNGLKSALQNMVNQPGQPTFQQAVATHRENIRNVLEVAPSDSFSPSWRQMINEMGISFVLGSELLGSIEDVFAKNQITPSVALKGIAEIAQSLQLLEERVNEAIVAFDYLEIGIEAMSPGQCEVGYLIPRAAVSDNLSELHKEIGEWLFIVNHFSELVHGEKQEFKIRTLSSSDFMVYLFASIGVGQVVAQSVQKIIEAYKTILEVKLLRAQLKEKGVPEKQTQGIDAHANSRMTEVIKQVVSDVLRAHYRSADGGRKNELSNALTISLNKLANRIDRGFSVEVRVEPLPAPKQGVKEAKELTAQRQAVGAIQKASKGIEFAKPADGRILQLPEALDSKKKAKRKRASPRASDNQPPE